MQGIGLAVFDEMGPALAEFEGHIPLYALLPQGEHPVIVQLPGFILFAVFPADSGCIKFVGFHDAVRVHTPFGVSFMDIAESASFAMAVTSPPGIPHGHFPSLPGSGAISENGAALRLPQQF